MRSILVFILMAPVFFCPVTAHAVSDGEGNELFSDVNVGIGTTLPSSLLEVGARMFNVTVAGNVGIGTILPGSKMDVVNGAVRIMSDPATAVISRGAQPGSLYIQNDFEVDGKIYGDGSALTGISAISGLTDNYIPRANGTSAIENSIMYDDGTNIGISLGSPIYKLDVNGGLRSSRYILGSDLSLLPVAGGQSVIGTWWGLQLVGNRQSAVDYTPANVGAAGSASVIIPNQQPASIGLIVQGAAAQSGSLQEWRNSGGTPLAVVSSAGNVGVGTSLPAALFQTGYGTPNAMTITGNDLYVRGNIELDGRIYGDGSGLTGLNSITNWDVIGDPSGAGSIAFGATVQTMDWATANTQAALTMNANALTTGQLLTLSHGTSVIANGGSLARISSTSADTATTTGVLLDLSSTASTAGTQFLQTYSGLTTGIGESIIANALTSGSGLSLTSSSAALTGDLVIITASGNNAAVTGSALKVGLTGGSAVGTALNVTSAGSSGYALRVNDNGTYTDATPFVVDHTGNVGVGTSLPAALLQTGYGTPNAMTITGNDLYVRGNIELDGRIYGDGSGLTGISSITNWDVIGDPSGAGSIAFGATVQTMDWATATTQNALSITGNGLSSGTLLNISSNGTAALTGQKGLNIALSGTNSSATQTTYGAYISNAHAGATSTNVALYAEATGGTSANYAAIFNAGNVGIGTAAPVSTLEIAPAGTLAVPQGTAPSVSKAGQVAVDVTDDQFVYYGTAKRVLPYERTICVTIENLAAADDNFGFFSAPDNMTLARGWCHCQGTCTTEATITLETVQVGTAGPTVDAVGGTITCADMVAGASATTLTADNTVDALDVLRFDVTNTPSPPSDEYTLCVVYTFDAQ